MNLFFLFLTFFRIGLFSIGGGLATLPFLNELADKNVAAAQMAHTEPVLTRENVANDLAVAQSLPGAIGVNLSAYTGYRLAGPAGSYAAALGLVAPSIVIIVIIARMLKAFKESRIVKSLFAGFRPAAAGLLSAAAFGAITLSLWSPNAAVWYEHIRLLNAGIFVVFFFLIYKFKKHPVVYIAAAGVLGVVLGL